jgi:hypothetical protein
VNYELLQRIADGERTFARRDLHDEVEGRTFDRAVEDLMDLQARLLISMWPNVPHLNRQTRHGTYSHTGVCELTDTGRRALSAHSRR